MSPKKDKLCFQCKGCEFRQSSAEHPGSWEPQAQGEVSGAQGGTTKGCIVGAREVGHHVGARRELHGLCKEAGLMLSVKNTVHTLGRPSFISC